MNGPSLTFDLETASAAELFRYPRGKFTRLTGIIGATGEPYITADPDLGLLGAAGELAGHNIMGYDGLVLAWHHGMDWDSFAARARDTMIIDRQNWPPRSLGKNHSADRYDLSSVAKRLDAPAKTDNLAALARKHGGYDQIPQDDPEYRSYLEGDLRASLAIGNHPAMQLDDYTRREHQVAAIAGHMSLNGFRVDRELLDKRLAWVARRKSEALAALHEIWGLPVTKTVTRGRGDKKHQVELPVPSPMSTNAGRDWLGQMWDYYQIENAPRTDGGKLATGKDRLAEVRDLPGCPGNLREMLKLIGVVVGSRTVYETIWKCLCPDGRVHPLISMAQASGRWSVTNPGLTVLGKREGRHIERDILLPDEGHVLIGADLEQVDMRGIAGLCQDPNYMALFADGVEHDAHEGIALQVYGTTARRQDAKKISHGWNYGLGPKAMIRDGIPEELVWAFINGMQRKFPQLISWREMIRQQCKQPGWIMDNGFGRRMRCVPERSYTAGPALMGQGSARDIMAQSLLRLDRALDPYLRLSVHDEVLVSCPAAEAEEVIAEMRRAFTWEWRGVPIRCKISGPGNSWGMISGDH